jgi:hypothetical protein
MTTWLVKRLLEAGRRTSHYLERATRHLSVWFEEVTLAERLCRLHEVAS